SMRGQRRDLAGVQAEFGVPAQLMVDYQTLVGDTVDNVPGVEKVGPKTAAKWLLEYGSLDALVARAGEIKGVAGENLRKALDWLPQGRQLVTIKTDCDLVEHVAGLPALDAMRVNEPEHEALQAFYERYGFKTLAAKAAVGKEAPAAGGATAVAPGLTQGLFDEAPPPQAEERAPVKYDIVLSWDAFDAWYQRLQAAELVALDTETTS